ncbi:MAG: hypothetical protein IJL98_01335 [Lachnospiraceae bacterium]|nr:hypothetical protein [Lachnospiraceae bacterium]
MLKIIKRILIPVLLVSVLLFAWGYRRAKLLTDNAGPKISMEEKSITVSVTDPEEMLLKGITAYDEKDGDVTGSIVIQSLSNFIEKGRRTMVIASFDQDNNVTKAEREIVYSDYHSPEVRLDYPLVFSEGLQAGALLSGFTVTDCLDGDLTNDLTVELENPDSYLDTTLEGSAKVIYTVVNSVGDILEIPATIRVYNTAFFRQASRVHLKTYLTAVKQGETLDPFEQIESVEIKGEELRPSQSQVEIRDPADTSVPGVYEVLYTVKEDGKTDNSLEIRQIVIVEQEKDG